MHSKREICKPFAITEERKHLFLNFRIHDIERQDREVSIVGL